MHAFYIAPSVREPERFDRPGWTQFVRMAGLPPSVNSAKALLLSRVAAGLRSFCLRVSGAVAPSAPTRSWAGLSRNGIQPGRFHKQSVPQRSSPNAEEARAGSGLYFNCRCRLTDLCDCVKVGPGGRASVYQLYERCEKNQMMRVLTLLGTIGAGLLTAVFITASAWAAPAISPAVVQTERVLDGISDVVKVHGWHCGWRRGHRHRGACGGYDPAYDDPYDEPYYEPHYDSGIPNVVIGPLYKPRARGRCTRRVRNHCLRRWRGQPGRRARCLRKYRCRY